jgi:hypothetical protein
VGGADLEEHERCNLGHELSLRHPEEKVEYVVGCESLTFTAKVQVGD